MKFSIGFSAQQEQQEQQEDIVTEQQTAAKKSVVQVYFPSRNMKLAYYNDAFDLHKGDMVYVDGKLEGLRGRVIDVSYTFKIKLSEYKRVIAVIDTAVNAQLFMTDSYFITFDPTALPKEKVSAWYIAPEEDEDIFVSGSDDSSFPLDKWTEQSFSSAIVQRGYDYYMNNKVKYLCIDGTSGYAVVQGTQPYTVEFTYRNGEIGSLTCSCFCSFHCKHEVAVMLQLQDLLKSIEKTYQAQLDSTGYFAAIDKESLFLFSLAGRENGSITISTV